MADLPKNFPEYLIMYKTLNKKIQELKENQHDIQDNKTIEENQLKIKTYQNEVITLIKSESRILPALPPLKEKIKFEKSPSTISCPPKSWTIKNLDIETK